MKAPLTVLVVAKAPVPGEVKTRLAADLGGDHHLAAELAAASLLDTIAACGGVGTRRRIALAGDLARAVRGEEIRRSLSGWEITGQRGAALGSRLAAAHGEVDGAVVQVGMDTPQLTADLLRDVTVGLRRDDAVLAPATDGGWWALAVRAGALAAPVGNVAMSTPSTYDETRAALLAAGLSVGSACLLSDVDHLRDAEAVAAAAPATFFARAARRLGAGVPG